MVDVSRRSAPARPDDPVAAALFGAGRPAGRPLLVSVAADGEREEVSARALGLWVAKTANLVTDDLGLGAGDVVALRLPCHWQAWGWLLGARWAGTTVELGLPSSPPPADAAAVVASAVDAAGLVGGLVGGPVEVVALSLLPLAVPGPVPAGVLDYDTDVRAHGDRFVPSGPVGPVLPAATVPAPTLVDASGAARAAAAGDLVLTGRMPADAAQVHALVAAMAAGAALLLAPDLPAAAMHAVLTAAIAAEGPTLALAADDAEVRAALPLLRA